MTQHCGEMLCVAGTGSPFSQIHFVPKFGNQITINGVDETIPSAIGVISGGVIGTYNNASINKVTGQTLAANTTYYVYVYMNSGTMTMDFSTTDHIEDTTYGNQVCSTDVTRSLVGMIHTDSAGKFRGDANRQNTISWFNRGHTGLQQYVTSPITLTNPTSHIYTGIWIEFMTFGTNNSFKQAYTCPNIYFQAYVTNSTVAKDIDCVIKVYRPQDGGVGTFFSMQGYAYQAVAGKENFIQDFCLGAAGADEGMIRAELWASNKGTSGNVTIQRGALFTSPLWS